MKLDNRDDIVRQFFALFLNSTVRKDGQVPGFDEWWRKATEHARFTAMNCAEWAAVKIQRDGRDASECIAAGVSYARDQIQRYRPPATPPLPSKAEVAEVVRVIIAHVEAHLGNDQPVPLRPSVGDERYFGALRERRLPPAMAATTTTPANLGEAAS